MRYSVHKHAKVYFRFKSFEYLVPHMGNEIINYFLLKIFFLMWICVLAVAKEVLSSDVVNVGQGKILVSKSCSSTTEDISLPYTVLQTISKPPSFHQPYAAFISQLSTCVPGFSVYPFVYCYPSRTTRRLDSISYLILLNPTYRCHFSQLTILGWL